MYNQKNITPRNKFSKQIARQTHKAFLKFLKKIINKLKDILFSWIRKLSIVKMTAFPKLIYQLNAIPIKAPVDFLWKCIS